MKKKLLLPNSTIKRNLPINYSVGDKYLFSNELNRKLPKLYSFHYKNVCINSNQYLWKFLKLLEVSFFRRDNRRKEKVSNFKFLLKSLFKKKRKIEKGLWLIDNWSHGYFHWFGDVIQKYYALNNYNAKLILPYSYSKIDFIIESSNFLNIDLEFVFENEVLKCKKLTIVPTTFISGNFYNDIMLKIQSKFSNTITSNKANKILYLSREMSGRRKVINDAEIRNLIKKKGGVTLMLEQKSWVEQLGYFQNCEILISPHGGGLSNMFLCSKTVKIIELRHHNSKIQNMYFSMSSALYLDYFYIICDGKEKDPHISNINVPIGKLNFLIDELIN